MLKAGLLLLKYKLKHKAEKCQSFTVSIYTNLYLVLKHV